MVIDKHTVCVYYHISCKAMQHTSKQLYSTLTKILTTNFTAKDSTNYDDEGGYDYMYMVIK